MQVWPWLRLALAVSFVSLSLVACGFQLRTPPQMNFKTVQLTGFASSSPLASELARAIEAAGADVVESTLEATQKSGGEKAPATHVIFEAQQDSRDQIAASPTAYGQIRDITTKNVLRYRVLRADGSELIPSTRLEIANILTFNEKDALAKADEFEGSHRAMQSDIVQQVIRRLAAIRADQLAP